ncbi:acyl-CoA dehydrogenase family protein [Ramlibacter ginsenosidimutans]|uniref:acyl-CoA dehydrogenase family protein n=2 Tax=Ramlibacter ginsenosidimutans TaxID=502333 RepID=UPI00363D8B8E
MQDMNSSPATGFAQLLAAVRKVTQDVAAAHADDVDAKARFPIETLAGLREYGVLSAAVPRELGGAGCNLQELSQLCATLAQSCGSSAMVLAMHYIQLACIARHGMDSEWWRTYLRDLVRRQDLLASMTSEVGTFGDTRSSVCAVRRSDGRFRLDKDATTGSYCAHADAILVTCRRDEDAARSDQLLVLVKREDAKLTQTSTWDTMGMRGTCSPGFKLESAGDEAQILPAPFADISAQTMVPYSHVLWSSLWWGIAAGALNKAANFVRGQARQNPGTTPPAATRLAEASVQLHGIKQNWLAAARDFDALGDSPAAREELLGMGWALRLNELKIACSEASPEIVQRALKIVGILGYKNDSPFALGRPLRDALSGALMISNDRIAAKNASMLLVHKEIA